MDISSINPDNLSSAIRQYYDIKIKNLDKVIFFQLGDFFEMFFEDAIYMNKVCGLTLTSKSAGLEEKIPMSGIPLSCLDEYVKMVIDDNHKIVVVEQVEGENDKIMHREITKIISPVNYLEDIESNKFIGCVYYDHLHFYFSYGDPNTGEMFHTCLSDMNILLNEISNNNIMELIVINNSIKLENINNIEIKEVNVVLEKDLLTLTDNVLLNYITELNCNNVEHIQPFIYQDLEKYLQINPITQRSLELIPDPSNNHDTSLFNFINKTHTTMGKRYLKEILIHPLRDEKQINKRLDKVNYLYEHGQFRNNLKQTLKSIYDLDRLINKISDRRITPKDIVQLRCSLQSCIELRCVILDEQQFSSNFDALKDIRKLVEYLEVMILESPNLSVKEGGVINTGVNKELDELHQLTNNSHEWFKNYEAIQREKTGCKNLKVKHSKILGYFIEIPLASSNLALPEYIEKQSLVNCKRYITPELQEVEQKIFSARDRISNLEVSIYEEIKDNLLLCLGILNEYARAVSEIDVLQSLATISIDYQLVRPNFNDQGIVEVKDGFHIVVKSLVDNYVNNDIYLDNDKRILLITGPNMAGKSTYMRQIAITIILAQIGCFVPASYANLTLFDQLFTRIGANDDTFNGNSTFMVEMEETAFALNNATKDSLILFDELGRGTSTYDGMSLAASIINYIDKHIGAKTLFSTHYHELIQLEETIDSLHNVHVKAIEQNGNITFLHKVLPGGVENSYGIAVAKLAHLPVEVTTIANQYLDYFTQQDEKHIKEVTPDIDQMKLKILSLMNNINPDETTPVQALELIYEIKKVIEEEDGK